MTHIVVIYFKKYNEMYLTEQVEGYRYMCTHMSLTAGGVPVFQPAGSHCSGCCASSD